MQGTFVRSAALSALPGSVWPAAYARPGDRGGRHGAEPGPGGRSPDRTAARPAAVDPGQATRGFALPGGFTGRIVARSGEREGGVVWHAAPDGGGCFPDGDGWIYVSNCALPLLGGVTALRFAPDGRLRSGYRILSGVDRAGAGAATPWHTWLSCERTPYGRVFECDPYGLRAPMPRLAMGLFTHAGAACDPDHGVVYLTEGEPGGCLYRFRPDDWGDLTTGVLEVMTGVPGEDRVTWQRVPTPAGARVPVREQVEGALRFAGGGECHYAGGVCRFAAGGRVWAYDPGRERLVVLHDVPGRADPATGSGDGSATGSGSGSASEPGGGDDGAFEARFGGEDSEIIVVRGDRAVPFLSLTDGWTVAGPSLSPAADRLYFSCRPPWAPGSALAAVTVEIAGPFAGLVRD